MANINGVVAQTPGGLSAGGKGDDKRVSVSAIGDLFTVDWKIRLMMAGFCYRLTVATFPADSDITQIVGGGAGTTLELEKPEGAIGVGTGYFLIPMEVDIACESDNDAPNDYMRIVTLVDRTAGLPTSVTGVVETPVNLLDGGAAFPGRAFSAITTDIVDPTIDELLFMRSSIATVELVLNGTATNITVGTQGALSHHWEASVPSAAAGPCGLYFYWGGTVATKGWGTAIVAAVPSAYLPIT